MTNSETKAKYASCVLIKNDQGLYLALERSDGKGFGFPGGKVDPGETFLEAAIRECFEETGHVVSCDLSVEPYTAICGSHMAATYMAKTAAIGTPTHSHEGKVVWATKGQLINKSEFGQYNKDCLDYFENS